MLKQYIILPKRPKMSPGKLASQAVHASFMAIDKQTNHKSFGFIEEWKKTGQCVVVLECKDQLELIQAAKYLEQWDVPHHLYIDEGYTETPPLTATALSTGVLDGDRYSWMFERFELFK